jgi:exonuclease III
MTVNSKPNQQNLSAFNISSFNVNGFNDTIKRKEYYTYLNLIEADIVGLVDTRMSADTEGKLKNEYKNYNSFNVITDNPARGTSILIRKDLPITIHSVHRDNREKNYIMVLVEIYNQKVILTSLYGPTGDRPEFFRHLTDTALNFQADHVVYVGDYNVTLDQALDNENYRGNRNRDARQMLNTIIEQHNLHDSMREKLGRKHAYTWFRNGGDQMARLDYILHSHSLHPYVTNTKFLGKIKSDHRGVQITIDFSKFKGNRGPYKIPTHLLQIEDYRIVIKDGIKEVYRRNYKPAGRRRNWFRMQMTRKERLSTTSAGQSCQSCR